eukprot:TRINITY_DN8678_c0_g1_i1.p1 TRINITY_DN8678_c0_g1~~TRINITY_DN8678_c0_g1_i1.p1  ORF type:complete len:295 (+),score=46.49 TRINITY_DN8678_c0_g1_i1:69-953(+)
MGRRDQGWRTTVAAVAAAVLVMAAVPSRHIGRSMLLSPARQSRSVSMRHSDEKEIYATCPMQRLFYINLDRRVERRHRFERFAQAQGLAEVMSRFPAVDGQSLEMEAYPTAVVSRPGLEAAFAPPNVVNGYHLTRGALGLILSYHTLLKRIAADPNEDHVYVVAEDDAVLTENFNQRLGLCLQAVWQEDPRWDFIHVGYYDDDCSLAPLESPANEFLCRPVQVFGLFGAAIRPGGARLLLQHLFPLDEQIDSALARVYGIVRCYASRPPLMRAAHSTAENSDIQILPEGFRWRG